MTDATDNALIRHEEDSRGASPRWATPKYLAGDVEAMKRRADSTASPVTHPSHYQSDNGIECIDAIRAALGREGFIAHCRGTAIKYAWLSGKKAAHAEDLRKACVYLEWAAKAIEEGD